MTIEIGDLVRIRPGLRNRNHPDLSGRIGIVAEIENDHLIVLFGSSYWTVYRSEIVQ
jgi:hypothetical protein